MISCRKMWVAAGAVAIVGTLGMAMAATGAAKTTLSVAMWLNNPQSSKTTQAILNAYAAKNNINIKLTYSPWDGFLDKLLTMTAAGQTPDVMVVERRWLPQFAANKLVRPLDDVVAAERFNPNTALFDTRSGSYAGKFYGFPIWGGPIVSMYNPTLFAAAGVPDPWQQIAADKWDWNGFVEMGRKLTIDKNGDGKPDVFAMNGLSAGWLPNWVLRIRQAGGEVFDESYKKVLVNEPAAIEGIQYWLDLANRYNIAPKFGAGADFGGKKAAMSDVWLSEALTQRAIYAKQGVNIQLTVFPKGKAGYANVAGGCPVCVSASTKHFKEAYKLVKWFAMESDMWKLMGTPASKAIYENEYGDLLAKDFGNVPQLLKMSMINAKPEPVIHARNKLLEPAQAEAMGLALAGKISAQQAAQRMADALQRIISRK